MEPLSQMWNDLLINTSKEHPQQGTKSTGCDLEGENGLMGSRRCQIMSGKKIIKGRFQKKWKWTLWMWAKPEQCLAAGVNAVCETEKHRCLPFGCGLKSEIGSCPFSLPYSSGTPSRILQFSLCRHSPGHQYCISHFQMPLSSLDVRSINKGADPHRASGRRWGKGYVLSFYPACTVSFSKQPNNCGLCSIQPHKTTNVLSNFGAQFIDLF